MRKKTRQVNVGGVPIGGGAPIPVQSMTNTDTRDIDATVAQIMRMKKGGRRTGVFSDFKRLGSPALSQTHSRQI